MAQGHAMFHSQLTARTRSYSFVIHLHVPMQELESQLTIERSQTAAAVSQVKVEQMEKASIKEELQTERARTAQMADELDASAKAIITAREEVEQPINCALVIPSCTCMLCLYLRRQVSTATQLHELRLK